MLNLLEALAALGRSPDFSRALRTRVLSDELSERREGVFSSLSHGETEQRTDCPRRDHERFSFESIVSFF